jgi:hypothetical protein
MAMNAELRGGARLERELGVRLLRPHGNPVESRTRNICAGGMCVETRRPLAIDEVLAFQLETGIEGTVRVLREHLPNVYALRFEELSLEALSRLERLS